MTTKAQLEQWFDAGVAQGATHMVVVCDTFDWSDFPVYVRPGQDPWAVYRQYDGPSLQQVMEVYDLQLDRALQMAEPRAFHF